MIEVTCIDGRKIALNTKNVCYIIEGLVKGCHIVMINDQSDAMLHVEETYEEIGKKWNFL
jgi:uncharacterized protein YlzI (FlbEa/FlbD family)